MFTIFTKEDCKYCYKVKQVIQLTGNAYEELTLGEDFTRDDFISKFGKGSTFPQVIYDDEYLGGCIDTIKFLKEKQIV